jgi:selenium-binding protein 1
MGHAQHGQNGLIPEILLGANYGRRLHFWDLHKRKHVQEIDFGPEYKLVFELRPAHDPTKPTASSMP